MNPTPPRPASLFDFKEPYGSVKPHKSHRLTEQSQDTFDRILNDGTLGAMSQIALNLVENYKDSTVKELLHHGYNDGVYSRLDHNLIAPRLTDLVNAGVIYRPSKRPCKQSDDDASSPVYVHRLAPESWRQHIRYLKNQGNKNFVKNRYEKLSKSDGWKVHTTIEWTDGSVSCSCNETYGRPSDILCVAARGIILASTGTEPTLEAIKTRAKSLERSRDKYKSLYEDLKAKCEAIT